MTRPTFSRTEPVEHTRSARIQRLVAEGDVDAFWAQVRHTGTPLVEDDPAGDPDRRAVTFVWRTDQPAARVLLHANKFTDYDDLDACSLRLVPGTDVGYRTFRLPVDWRASYVLAPLPAGDPLPSGRAARDLLLRGAGPDPFNRSPMVDHVTGAVQSVAELPGAPPQRWVDGVADLGHVRFHSEHLDGDRALWTYRPPVPAPPGGHPLLVLLDGEIWARRHPVAPTLDALIVAGALPPFAAVLVDGVDPAQRTGDLTANPAFVAFLVEEALPRAFPETAMTSDPARTVIAGQSFGGLAAVHAARLAPERFGNVLAQSGSFWWPRWRPGDWPAGPGVRFHLQVGSQEWGLPPLVRRLRDDLAARGYAVDLREYCGGHDRACWRGGLVDGLAALTAGWCPDAGSAGQHS